MHAYHGAPTFVVVQARLSRLPALLGGFQREIYPLWYSTANLSAAMADSQLCNVLVLITVSNQLESSASKKFWVGGSLSRRQSSMPTATEDSADLAESYGSWLPFRCKELRLLALSCTVSRPKDTDYTAEVSAAEMLISNNAECW